MRISSLLLNLYPLYYKLVFFIGILPLIVYPFSIYFWIKSDYKSYNHGPLYEFDEGAYQCEDSMAPKPNGKPGVLAFIMTKTYVNTIVYVITLSFIISFIQFISQEFKNSLKYFRIILTYLLFGLFQFMFLFWLIN